MRDCTGYRLPNVFRPGEWAPLRRFCAAPQQEENANGQLMSTPPSRDQLLVHRLKTPESTRYVWEVLSCEREHVREECKRRACAGKGAGACADA